MSESGNAIRINHDGVWHIDAWAIAPDHNAQPGDWIKIVISATGAGNTTFTAHSGETLMVSASSTSGFAENDTTMIWVETSGSIPYRIYTATFYVGPWTPPPSGGA